MYKWYIAIGLNLLQVFPSVPPFVFVQWSYLLYTVFSCLVAVPTEFFIDYVTQLLSVSYG